MSTTKPKASTEISCLSLGMVILDEIRMPNKLPLLNVIGGSATFVTLGLRLFATQSLQPGCLVMAGSDFPKNIKEEMRTWCTSLVIKDTPDLKSSRGLLTYHDDTFGPKTFEYTTPPIRPSPRDLIGTPLLHARAFHFFGRPDEILEQVPELLAWRQQHQSKPQKPFIIWEPLPSSCTPANLPAFLSACELVDIFSPNHLELAAFFPDEQDAPTTHVLSRLEAQGRVFTNAGIGPSKTGTCVIRAGVDGALALQANHPCTHIPAFYDQSSEAVVDPTGAGNAFLGGYIAGFLHERDVRQALCYGTVAASFALEQIGLPNSADVSVEAGEARLREFRERLEM